MRALGHLSTLIFVLLIAWSSLAADAPIIVKFERKDGHVMVPVKINGRGPYMMGVDTGAPYSFVTTRVGSQLGVGMRGGRVRFEIGALTLNNAPLMTMNHPNMKQSMAGILGYAFLSHFRFTIDFPNKEITFHGPPDGKLQTAASASSRTVVFGAAVEDLGPDTREARVVHVAQGSAAESADLQRGDRIVEINGRHIGAPTQLFEALGALSAGQTARLKIVRNGKPMELTVTLRAGL